MLTRLKCNLTSTWWRHQMETFSALLAICAGNSPVPGEFPTQRPVTRSFDVYFDLRPNKRPSKQSWGWWFQTQSRPLWRHRNGIWDYYKSQMLLCMLHVVNLRLNNAVSMWHKYKCHFSLFHIYTVHLNWLWSVLSSLWLIRRLSFRDNIIVKTIRILVRYTRMHNFSLSLLVGD